MKKPLAFFIALLLGAVVVGYAALYFNVVPEKWLAKLRHSGEWQPLDLRDDFQPLTDYDRNRPSRVAGPQTVTTTHSAAKFSVEADTLPQPTTTVKSANGTVDLLGIVVPAQRARVRAEVVERLVELAVHEGDSVQEGQLVGHLDSQALALDLQSRQCRISALAARVEEAKKLVEIAQDRRKRSRTVGVTGTIPEAERVKDELDLEAAEFRQQALEHDHHEAVLQAKRVEYLLKDYDLVSPLSGIVTQVVHRPGELVDQAEVVLRVQSHQILLRIHLSRSLMGRVPQTVFEYFQDDWQQADVHLLSPEQNPDGSRNLLLKMQASDKLSVGQVLKVRARLEAES